MLAVIKKAIASFFASRERVLITLFVLFACVLSVRLFVLQIIHGQEYQDNYNLKLEKTETIDSTRGNIYDRNGKLLAYNELVYAVTIEDVGTYKNSKERNKAINTELARVIKGIEQRGDTIDNDFGIIINSAGDFEFTSSGTALKRFKADIFGYTSIDSLKYNEKMGFNEADATASQIMDYLCSEYCYRVKELELDKRLAYEVCVIRYNMGLNAYKKYIATTIASDISDESVAFLMENINELTGVEVQEQSLRRYTDSECLSHIIGYTGTISVDEYNTMVLEDPTVEADDIVGKSGIEKYMNSYLRGTKGHSTLYVDSVGNTIAEGEKVDAVAGNNVYLSIDYEIQSAAYQLLQQEIAGIVYSKIQNIKKYTTNSNSSASDVVIPIYDVYYALINNNVIDSNHFSSTAATDVERNIKSAYDKKFDDVIESIKSQLTSSNPIAYENLSDEYQEYSTFIVKKLKEQDIFKSSAIDESDDMQKKWTSLELSVKDYLTYAIEQSWIDIVSYETEIKYADTDELYEDLIENIINTLIKDRSFARLVYKYAILEDRISGEQLCLCLYDQEVFPMESDNYANLSNGVLTPYNFLKSKIKTLELTPAQLGLDPCSGSSVIVDTQTGNLLACVSYPGFDNNRLANTVDSNYYSYLLQNSSNPLYNYATQQRTAPGSTFKVVTSTAGLAEGVLYVNEQIEDTGVFEKVSNKPKCWNYPYSHGLITMAEALRDSCNVFFYEVGFRLAGGETYNDKIGIDKLAQYASMYGLNEKTGVEIEENDPHVATEFPVMAAIGQSDNNYTTICLGRYAASIANRGSVYNLTLLDSVRNNTGDILEQYSPSVRNHVDVLDTNEWDNIHYGMRMVCQNLHCFDDFSIEVAGKTGTAQQTTSRPNHALFIGFAPYSNPKIAIATRIAYGYTSHNAAEVSQQILSYYFGLDGEDILSGEATEVSDSQNSFTD